ncbi:MAG: DUF2283 domain-containing protein [Patescibacteria group bacterium]
MKVHYDKDEDILMMVLSKKKVDDTYETEFGTVSVSAKGEPVLVEIFNATDFFEKESEALPREIKEKFFQAT